VTAAFSGATAYALPCGFPIDTRDPSGDFLCSTARLAHPGGVDLVGRLAETLEKFRRELRPPF
jgi:hypothetical protein